jgi:hypothetical protein
VPNLREITFITKEIQDNVFNVDSIDGVEPNDFLCNVNSISINDDVTIIGDDSFNNFDKINNIAFIPTTNENKQYTLFEFDQDSNGKAVVPTHTLSPDNK